MSASKKLQVKAAHEMGRKQARAWLKPEAVAVRARTFSEWRAICYATAVMQFELEPRLMLRLNAWEQGFDDAVGELARSNTAAQQDRAVRKQGGAK